MKVRVLAGVAACLTLAACSSQPAATTPSSSGGGATQAGPAKVVAYVSPVGSQPGQQQVNLGLEGAAAAEGWQSKVVDANLSAEKQVSLVNTLTTQKVSAIASWTLDPNAVAGAYTQAEAAGIPIIGVNSTGPGVHATVWWEVNHCNAGGTQERSAKYIAKVHPNAKVIIIGGPPAPSITANVACFKKAAAAEGLQVIDQVDNTADAASPASRLVSDMLTKHPDVQAFWAYNDQSALGAGAAIEGAGKKIYSGSGDGIITIGMNGDPDAIAAGKAGRLTGSWDTDSVATGWAVGLAMKDSFDGKPAKNYTVKSVFWTKENVDQYVEPAKRNYSFTTIPLVDTPAGQ